MRAGRWSIATLTFAAQVVAVRSAHAAERVSIPNRGLVVARAGSVLELCTAASPEMPSRQDLPDGCAPALDSVLSDDDALASLCAGTTGFVFDLPAGTVQIQTVVARSFVGADDHEIGWRQAAEAVRALGFLSWEEESEEAETILRACAPESVRETLLAYPEIESGYAAIHSLRAAGEPPSRAGTEFAGLDTLDEELLDDAILLLQATRGQRHRQGVGPASIGGVGGLGNLLVSGLVDAVESQTQRVVQHLANDVLHATVCRENDGGPVHRGLLEYTCDALSAVPNASSAAVQLPVFALRDAFERDLRELPRRGAYVVAAEADSAPAAAAALGLGVGAQAVDGGRLVHHALTLQDIADRIRRGDSRDATDVGNSIWLVSTVIAHLIEAGVGDGTPTPAQLEAAAALVELRIRAAADSPTFVAWLQSLETDVDSLSTAVRGAMDRIPRRIERVADLAVRLAEAEPDDRPHLALELVDELGRLWITLAEELTSATVASEFEDALDTAVEFLRLAMEGDWFRAMAPLIRAVAAHVDGSVARVMWVAVEILEAETREEMAAVLEDSLVPATTYLEKRVGPMISVGARVGLTGGYELVLDDTRTSNGTRLGVSAPIGVGFSWPIGGQKRGTFEVLVGVLDIGAVMDWRVDDPDGSTESTEDDVDQEAPLELAALVAPSGSIQFGLGRTPLVLALGCAYHPAGRGEADSGLVDDAVRFSATLGLDVPLWRVSSY